MHVIVFIIIAYALRHRYLDEGADREHKFFYYAFSAAFSPVVGIPAYIAFVKNANPMSEEEERRHRNDCVMNPDT